MYSFGKVLPLGTIVTIEKLDLRLMIIGYQCKSENEDDKVYDYCACTYPEGYLSLEKVILFNHDSIDKIIYIGLQNKEQEEFAVKLQKAIEENRI